MECGVPQWWGFYSFWCFLRAVRLGKVREFVKWTALERVKHRSIPEDSQCSRRLVIAWVLLCALWRLQVPAAVCSSINSSSSTCCVWFCANYFNFLPSVSSDLKWPRCNGEPGSIITNIRHDEERMRTQFWTHISTQKGWTNLCAKQ